MDDALMACAAAAGDTCADIGGNTATTATLREHWQRLRNKKASARTLRPVYYNLIIRYTLRPALGESLFLKLKTRAQAALGKQFDVKAFHDKCLELGSVPLNMLEQHLSNWIKKD